MTVDQLKYFYEAAKYQHIGKAAKAIHISPSAISAAIASLEHEFDLELFDRQGKTIALNLNGRALMKEAESILDSLQGLKMRLKGEEGDLKGQYRLGASHFLAAHSLTMAASELQKTHADLVFEVASLGSSQVVAEVLAGTLDLGVCFSPINHPNVVIEDVHKGQLVIAVRKNHPILKLKGMKAIKELSDYPSVVHKANPGVDICENHPVFEEHGIIVKTSFLFDSDECAVEKLARSDAWALLPEVVVQKYGKVLTAVELPPSWKASYKVSSVVRKDRSKNVVLRQLVEKLLYLQ